MRQTTFDQADSSPDKAEDRSEPNSAAAAAIRNALAQARIVGIRIIGHPGSGKTELIEATLKRLPAPRRVAVIVVNPAAARDAQRLRKLCGEVVHIDAAIPTAPAILRAVSALRLDDLDMVFIEAAGGLAPLGDLGQDSTVALFAVSGGDDKAAEYSNLINAASAVVLTKNDLRPLVKFNPQVFRTDVRSMNASAEVHELSAVDGSGMDSWLLWLEQMRLAKRRARENGDSDQSSSDSHFG